MTQTKAVVHAVLASAFLATVPVACGGAGDPSPQSNETASTHTDEATFTRTIVRRAADGTEKVATDQITPAQQIAEQHERAAIKAGERIPETLTEGCSGADITLADSASNEICFYNAGSSNTYAYLPNYTESCHLLRCTNWVGTNIYQWINSSDAASITDGSFLPCDWNSKGCLNTAYMPANNGVCNSDIFCAWDPPAVNINSNMNYLWMGTSSAQLCGISCPNAGIDR